MNNIDAKEGTTKVCNVLLLGTYRAEKHSWINFLFDPLSLKNNHVVQTSKINHPHEFMYSLKDPIMSLHVMDTPVLDHVHSDDEVGKMHHLHTVVQRLHQLKKINFVWICMSWDQYDDDDILMENLSSYKEMLQPLINRGAIGLLLTQMTQENFEIHTFDETYEKRKKQRVQQINTILDAHIDVCEVFGTEESSTHRTEYIKRIQQHRQLEPFAKVLDASYVARQRVLHLLSETQPIDMSLHLFPLPSYMQTKIKFKISVLMDMINIVHYALGLENKPLGIYMKKLATFNQVWRALWAQKQQQIAKIQSLSIIQTSHPLYLFGNGIVGQFSKSVYDIKMLAPHMTFVSKLWQASLIVTTHKETNESRLEVMISPTYPPKQQSSVDERQDVWMWYVRVWLEVDGAHVNATHIQENYDQLNSIQGEMDIMDETITSLVAQKTSIPAQDIDFHLRQLATWHHKLQLLQAHVYTLDDCLQVYDMLMS